MSDETKGATGGSEQPGGMDRESGRRRAETKLYGTLQKPSTKNPDALPVTGWDVDAFAGEKHCLVMTYKKSGEAVATPVWFVGRDDRLRFLTGSVSGKVKRLRRDQRVRVAPCSLLGRPRGPAMEGVARILDDDQAALTESALKAKYGIGRRLYYRFLGPDEHVYVEVGAPDAD